MQNMEIHYLLTDLHEMRYSGVFRHEKTEFEVKHLLSLKSKMAENTCKKKEILTSCTDGLA